MKRKFLQIVLIIAISGINYVQAQRISTFAGTGGVGGYSGDGGPATAAKIFYTNGIVIDSWGNMYITAEGYPSVRKVDTAGIITTIAGSSINLPGFSGDGGPATAAKLDEPIGIGIDKKRNVYFFDGNNKRVRKVDTAGIISTVAGNGSATPSGDGGPATAAGLGYGGGLCTDTTGNIYIGAGNFIRKVDTAGVITTIAGTGISGYSGDGGMASMAQIVTNGRQIALDTYGNLFIGDGGRIRKISTTGIITTIVGNGTLLYGGDGMPATAVGINPFGVCLNSNGNIYIADYDPACCIRKVSPAGIISTIAGSGTLCGFSGDGGPGTAAKLFRPRGVYMGKNNCLYFCDTRNYCVRRLDLNDSVFVSVPGVAQNEDAVKVHPNPAGDGLLYVRVSSAADEGVQLALMDVTGKKVQEETTTTNKETTMTLHAPSGLYLLHISKADKQWVQKVLVE